MGVMNKMRESTGAILWILVFAFGVIWVLQDSGGLDTIGQVGNNIGAVNGDPITVDEYNAAVDQHTHIAHAAADLWKDRLIGNDGVAIEFQAAHLFIDQRT